MSYTDQKSAQIEREIEEDRRRIEERIGAIQDKLSPGQLIDEMLAYAKGHGGGEFAANLKSSAVNNPLPVALIGVGLAWLMAKPTTPGYLSQPYRTPTADYPLAAITGDVRRSSSSILEGDCRYSHFEDSAGRKFKALADETGRRAGHFVDESGNTFRGFVDASGQQIERIKDEAGELLDEATGWTQRAWTSVTEALSDARSSVDDGRRSIQNGASSTLDTVQQQSARFNEMVQSTFRDQPLVGGALAFAFGAAIGAALPQTRQESALMGEAASKVRQDLSDEADKVLKKGSEMASEAYDRAATMASDLHDTAKDRIGEEWDRIAPSKPAETSQSPY